MSRFVGCVGTGSAMLWVSIFCWQALAGSTGNQINAHHLPPLIKKWHDRVVVKVKSPEMALSTRVSLRACSRANGSSFHLLPVSSRFREVANSQVDACSGATRSKNMHDWAQRLGDAKGVEERGHALAPQVPPDQGHGRPAALRARVVGPAERLLPHLPGARVAPRGALGLAAGTAGLLLVRQHLARQGRMQQQAPEHAVAPVLGPLRQRHRSGVQRPPHAHGVALHVPAEVVARDKPRDWLAEHGQPLAMVMIKIRALRHTQCELGRQDVVVKACG
eukprot:CAMPEP_0168364258 /NCGR_PEP_ID=MMETSP0228-20121227/4113_1 /TAXON_ID=133427 /ORGANISM="Protoceratium reticulatum, Strain CCCM 535 (=CCMP 1889)" /LENGTH=276 /DNA_ID=CAMNT_0008377009 /DNA_START=49 /DNA_END=879 /DNA_ORIENTATION=-